MLKGEGLVVSMAFAALQALGLKVVEQFFLRVATLMWDAEITWKEGGNGAAKREWVLGQLSDWLRTSTRLGWLQRRVVMAAAGLMVDSLIALINETLGDNWVEKADEAEKLVLERTPWLRTA